MNKINKLDATRRKGVKGVRIRCEVTLEPDPCAPKEYLIHYGHQFHTLESLLQAQFGDAGPALMHRWALAIGITHKTGRRVING